MDTLRLMLLSLLIGATVSTSPTYSTTGFNVNQTITFEQQQTASAQTQQSAARIVYVTPSPTSAATVNRSSASSSSSAKTISTGTSIKRELYRGCQGDDVRMLQKLLQDLGYNVSVDGYYGTQTRNAVISFQRNNGLKADGIAGTRTIRRLASSSAIPEGGGSNRTTLSYGMRGQDVLELQYRLAELGYYYDLCSGNYLTNTRAAVRWFQQVNGLPVDGIAGPITLSRVYSSSAIPATASPLPTSTVHGYFYRTLSQGMSGTDVTYLQQLLKDLGYFTGNPTGYFGSATYWAVSTFQKYNGLYSDGIAGTATQRVLTSGNAIPYPGTSTATPGPGPTPTPTGNLKPGELCTHCKQWIVVGEEPIHNSMLSCGHYACTPGEHKKLMSSVYTYLQCNHFMCQENEMSHGPGPCNVNKIDHYVCMGYTHNMRSCSLHYECEETGKNHTLFPCKGHYQCDPSVTSSEYHTKRCAYCKVNYCTIKNSGTLCTDPNSSGTHVTMEDIPN